MATQRLQREWVSAVPPSLVDSDSQLRSRTILQNPRLLMDEATSALDYHAERQVCLNLAEAFTDRTVFSLLIVWYD